MTILSWPDNRRSKIYAFYYSCIFITCSAQVKASEEEFWKLIESLNTKMLNSENNAKVLINKSELILNSAESPHLMRSAFISAKLDFLEFYASDIEVKNFLALNIGKLTPQYADYPVYLAKLAILHFKLGEDFEFKKAIEELNSRGSNILHAITMLTVLPTEHNHQELISFCNNECDFFLYDNAIANYYAINGHHQLLENFTVEVLEAKYLEGKQSKSINSRIFIAYLHLSQHCQQTTTDTSNSAARHIFEDIRHISGVFRQSMKILDIGCERT